MQRQSILAQEEELTLLVTSEDPDSIVQAVAGLKRLGRFSLVARERRNIRDVYYDRPDGLLGKRGWALRVREVNAAKVITLKGPPSPNESGGIQRLELEAPWSRDSLCAVLDLLAMSGIPVPEVALNADLSDPYCAVESMGMGAIQDRDTIRLVRHILPEEDEPGSPVGELVIDSVIYHFGEMNIGHYELELEAGSPGASEIIGSLAQLLLEEFGPALRPWNIGKTATGRRVEQLLAAGTIASLMRDGRLLPVAYDHMIRS